MLDSSEFHIGDIVELSGLKPKRGVIVGHDNSDRHALLVFFELDDYGVYKQGIYGLQRHWVLYKEYKVRQVEPTDQEQALAMRILLTSYIPGVDDE